MGCRKCACRELGAAADDGRALVVCGGGSSGTRQSAWSRGAMGQASSFCREGGASGPEAALAVYRASVTEHLCATGQRDLT